MREAGALSRFCRPPQHKKLSVLAKAEGEVDCCSLLMTYASAGKTARDATRPSSHV